MSARLSGSIEIVQELARETEKSKGRRARHTKSTSLSCRWRMPVLRAGHRDRRGARRNDLMVVIVLVMAGDGRSISRRRYFFTFCTEKINELPRRFFFTLSRI